MALGLTTLDHVPNRAAARSKPLTAARSKPVAAARSKPVAAARSEHRRSSSLTLEDILKAALVLADSGGLQAVSVRRIAERLGVRPMSLYTYVPSKGVLLDLMADEIVRQVVEEPARAGDWREAVSALARGLHQAFVEHSWVVAAFQEGRQPGPHTLRYGQLLAQAVSPLDLSAHARWALLGIVNDYTIGHALRVATAGNARTLGGSGTAVPDLDALREVDAARTSPASFELGLATVLDGIEARFVN